jgi:CubicO group peptidase (beta-lactamase class C family)
MTMRANFPRIRPLCFGAFIGLITFGALGESNVMAQDQRKLACGSPAALDDGWATATPESVGLDRARLCGIAARLQYADLGVHAVVVVRHGKLVFEQYFAGCDEPWGKGGGQHNFDAATKHDMRSISKSIISLLTGIAIDRKLIAGADEPVIKFFSEYQALKTPGWDAVTLRHILTMSSGIKWDEALPWTHPNNDEPHLGFEADPVGYVLAKPIAMPPDLFWTYNGGGTDLLGHILERVSGKPLEDFAREALFEPLGIIDLEWKTYSRNGKIAPAAGLRLRPRDAAKIGQLVLNQGRWGGRQIVPADWIVKSVTPRFQANGYFGGLFFYGYQWWMGRSLLGDREVKWTAAMGLGGQRIFIVPELDLVVMCTGGLYGRPKEGQGALDILVNSVIPSVR